MLLVERLKPDYKTILDSKREEFPTLVRNIIKHLSELELISDMKYGIWSDIRFFTEANSPFDVFEEL
tara:strand:- start:413 stop:613 length:201 start_codon:yes stop_codon:yes gene_type:complete